MLNWRHEPYRWVPCPGSELSQKAYGNLSFEAAALLTYIAKLADNNGVVEIMGDDAYHGLTRLIGVRLEERAAFRVAVDEITDPRLEPRRVIVGNGKITIASYKSWQTTKDPRVRVFRRETHAFASLPAFPRMYAAELVRVADDGVVGKSLSEVIDCRTATKASWLRASCKRSYDQRVSERLHRLVSDGFLIVADDGSVRIRNYGSAQSTRAQQDALREHKTSSEVAQDQHVSARNDSIQPVHPVPYRTVPINTNTESATRFAAHARTAAPQGNAPHRGVSERTPSAPSDDASECNAKVFRLSSRTPIIETSVPSTTRSEATFAAKRGEPPMQLSLLLPEPAAVATQATTATTEHNEQTPRKPSAAKPVKEPKAKPPSKSRAPRGATPEVTLACIDALASAAGDYFAKGEIGKWAKPVWSNASACALAFPDIADWTLVGEWMNANADDRNPSCISYVTSGNFTGWLARAQLWASKGRQRRSRYAPPITVSEPVAAQASNPKWDEAKRQGSYIASSMFGG